MTQRALIAPSILSANFACLERDIHACQDGGADLLHLDIMDGRFVPNITFGMPIVTAIRKVTQLPLDCHLMIEEPERYIDAFAHAGVDWISVHVEACCHIHRTLEHIHQCGKKAGLVLNPATPIEYAFDAAPWVDFILLMSVNPGFGGQRFIPQVLRRIERLRQWLTKEGLGIPIEVDGGVTADNAADLVRVGATILVSGAAVFSGSISQNIARIRSAIENI